MPRPKEKVKLSPAPFLRKKPWKEPIPDMNACKIVLDMDRKKAS